MKKILILGVSGFIGSHLAQKMIKQGHHVRGVDLKHNQFFPTGGMEFIIGDLRDPKVVETVFDWDLDEVYQLAALMGGAGYVFSGQNDADIFYSSALINLNVVNTAKNKRAKKIFFSSSACAYSQDFQSDSKNNPLSENMAYPANPDSDYGFEKLMSERLYQAYARNYGLNIRIARFHNIYGNHGIFYTGKEKAPAAMVRKAIIAKLDNKETIDVWGTGEQVRSFLYIDDCLDAVELLMASEHIDPINIGSAEFISINDLARMAISFTGRDIKINNIDGPVGVAGRSSDNTLVEEVLKWSPEISLKKGMEKLYKWMSKEFKTMPIIYERNPDTNVIQRSVTDRNFPNKQYRHYLKS